ncbi:TetR/AcrR family transcriptional regulator [Burkholderia gladioli]|uniref:TetR/AcrR family transcriptional regulator n=1 Tax=Burkholderia gladioli TaxID=28095 RepID=UPI000CDA6C39|nr:TetR/AcrR family transcriptional regulator [Burkholderia gladioli]POS05862.1 TetR/AcrR family transcriptional regulator [Burkholderia gladioli]
MARLTREESQAQTRLRLLEVATALFTRDGYAATSLERIAEVAGFSKGAVYSNFPGKEALFLEVLEAHGQRSLADLHAAIDGAATLADAIELIAGWADRHSRLGSWPLLVLEYARHAKPADSFRASQEAVLRSHWRTLGERLRGLDPALSVDAETLGALIFELTYAPAMSFVSRPTSGELLRAALGGLFGMLR